MNHHYSLLIQWSEADKLYLVTIPEFSEITMQPCTHGKTYEDAVNNAQEAIQSLLEYCQDEGIVAPSPAILQVA